MFSFPVHFASIIIFESFWVNKESVVKKANENGRRESIENRERRKEKDGEKEIHTCPNRPWSKSVASTVSIIPGLEFSSKEMIDWNGLKIGSLSFTSSTIINIVFVTCFEIKQRVGSLKLMIRWGWIMSVVSQTKILSEGEGRGGKRWNRNERERKKSL